MSVAAARVPLTQTSHDEGVTASGVNRRGPVSRAGEASDRSRETSAGATGISGVMSTSLACAES